MKYSGLATLNIGERTRIFQIHEILLSYFSPAESKSDIPFRFQPKKKNFKFRIYTPKTCINKSDFFYMCIK